MKDLVDEEHIWPGSFLVVLTPITKYYTHMLIEFLIKSKLVSLQNDSNGPILMFST